MPLFPTADEETLPLFVAIDLESRHDKTCLAVCDSMVRYTCCSHLLLTKQRYYCLCPTPTLGLTLRDLSKPIQAKVLTEGGDLREAQVDVPPSGSHTCV